MSLDVSELINDLAIEFGDELLMRSEVWMTLRESKSSFAIEGEADQLDRIQRFANVLSRRTGQGSFPLNQAALSELQSEILGKRTLGKLQDIKILFITSHHQLQMSMQCLKVWSPFWSVQKDSPQ